MDLSVYKKSDTNGRYRDHRSKVITELEAFKVEILKTLGETVSGFELKAQEIMGDDGETLDMADVLDAALYACNPVDMEITRLSDQLDEEYGVEE